MPLIGWLFATGCVVSVVVAPAVGVITHNGIASFSVFMIGAALVTVAQILGIRTGE